MKSEGLMMVMTRRPARHPRGVGMEQSRCCDRSRRIVALLLLLLLLLLLSSGRHLLKEEGFRSRCGRNGLMLLLLHPRGRIQPLDLGLGG